MNARQQRIREMSPADRRIANIISFVIIGVGLLVMVFSPLMRQVTGYVMYVLAGGMVLHAIREPQRFKRRLVLLIIAIGTGLIAWLMT